MGARIGIPSQLASRNDSLFRTLLQVRSVALVNAVSAEIKQLDSRQRGGSSKGTASTSCAGFLLPPRQESP
jgi:hypothetical protein